MSTAELACTYAALLLHDDGQEVTAEKLQSIIKAAGITVEPYWPGLFAKTLANKKIDDLITNIGSGAGGAPAAAAAPAAAGAAAPAAGGKAKKEEPKEEEEEEMGMSLFD